MKKNILPFLIAVVCWVVMPKVAVAQSVSNDNWSAFVDTNYTISYPNDWSLDTTGQLGAQFIITSPLDSEEDNFKENVNLMIEDLAGLDVQLKDYMVTVKEQYKTAFEQMTVIDEDEITLGNRNYHKLICSIDLKGTMLMLEQWYFIHHEKAYVLSFTCAENNYDSYKEVGHAILSSFKLEQAFVGKE